METQVQEVEAKPQPHLPRTEKGQFKVGHTGLGGRPKGSRNKLSEAFLRDLEASWETEGLNVIARTIEERPWDYLKVIAGILPQKIEVSRTDEMSQEEIDRAILRATSLLQEVIEPGASGATASEAQEAIEEQAR